MESRWCTFCAAAFVPRAQCPRQSYCTQPACQRERRRLWQKAKRRSDPDYLDNQLSAQRAWSARNADYWRAYRLKNPAYTEGNRLKQQARRAAKAGASVAKMDPSPLAVTPVNGTYRLTALHPVTLAKMDVWTVLLTLVTPAARPR